MCCCIANVGSAPVSPPVLQTQFLELEEQADTSSGIYTQLLLLDPIVVQEGSRLRVWFTASFIQTLLLGGSAHFRLRVDGTPQLTTASHVSRLTDPHNAALTFRTAELGAGSHSVEIQWRLVGVVAQVTIDPTGGDPVGHAALNVDEVTV